MSAFAKFFFVWLAPVLVGALFGIFEIGWRERRLSLKLLLLATTISAVLMGLAAIVVRNI